MANPLVTLRSATQSDIPAIKAIHSYYVLNTLITLAIVPSTDDELLSKYKSITSQGLPYIIAVDASANSAIGYAYVTGFRSFKGGYKHTVELSLFCHPEWRGQGVGTLLLKKILEVLKEPGTHPGYIVNPRSDDSRVRIIIACISVDEAGRDNALDLKQYYQKFGFELVGHLKKVGHKFDQWYTALGFACPLLLTYQGSIRTICSWPSGEGLSASRLVLVDSFIGTTIR